MPSSEELQVAFGASVSKAEEAAHRDAMFVLEKQIGDFDDRNSFERVKEFHEVFGHPVGDAPLIPTTDRTELRLALILEEAAELTEAMGFDAGILQEAIGKVFEKGIVEHPDLIGIIDALGDIEYVVNGAAIEYGVNLPVVVREIHRSNMTKLGPDGKPIYREDGKILKGEGYEQPDLEAVLGL